MQNVLWDEGITYYSTPQKIQLLNSTPFWQPSRYGNFRITSPIEKLINYYKASFGKCQGRILWTDVFFRCEVSHTILVHPKTPKFSEIFKDLPLIDKEDEEKREALPSKDEDQEATEMNLESEEEDTVIKRKGDKLTWRPQSTSIFQSGPETHKAWDQLTFAFLIPEEPGEKMCDGIKIPDEDLIELIRKMTLHDVSKFTDHSPDKGAQTKYEAMIRFLRSPCNNLPKHLHSALIYRFKEYYEELVRDDKYGNEVKTKGHDRAIEALDAAIQKLKAEEDMEADDPADPVRQLVFN